MMNPMSAKYSRMSVACPAVLLLALALTSLLLASAAPDWRPAPAYLPLFTPVRVPFGTFQTHTTTADLASVVRHLSGSPAFSAPGAFRVESVITLEAFGQSGGYDRWKLARLYGARRVTVARGPRMEGGRTVEAWTLISPYPDASLERLEPGTLRIVLRLD